MRENQLSRYGAFSRSLGLMSPGAKYHFVGLASLSWYGDFISEFGVDADGGNRVFPTLTAAIADSNVVASRGDVIVILPGYTQTISSSTALSISKAGLTIIGLGNGSLRPTFTLDTATTATINITAANIEFQNCLFVANFADVASCFKLTTAKNFTIRNCEFRDTTSILNFTAIVDTNTTSNDADGLSILDSNYYGLSATSNSCVVKMDGTNTRLTIKNSYFAHAATTGAGLMPIATGKVVTNAVIENNRFNFVGATGLTVGTLITTDGSTNSGLLHGNIIFDLDATSEILVTASSGFKFGINYSSAVADKSGYIVPAQDA